MRNIYSKKQIFSNDEYSANSKKSHLNHISKIFDIEILEGGRERICG
jgi:hypothetical protein